MECTYKYTGSNTTNNIKMFPMRTSTRYERLLIGYGNPSSFELKFNICVPNINIKLTKGYLLVLCLFLNINLLQLKAELNLCWIDWVLDKRARAKLD